MKRRITWAQVHLAVRIGWMLCLVVLAASLLHERTTSRQTQTHPRPTIYLAHCTLAHTYRVFATSDGAQAQAAMDQQQYWPIPQDYYESILHNPAMLCTPGPQDGQGW